MEMQQSLRNDQRLMIHTFSDSAAECQAGRRPALTLAHLLGPGEKEEVILAASFGRKYDTDAVGPRHMWVSVSANNLANKRKQERLQYTFIDQPNLCSSASLLISLVEHCFP